MTNSLRSRSRLLFAGLAAGLCAASAVASAQTAPPAEPQPTTPMASEPAPEPPPPPAPAVTTSNKGTLTVKGFVSATIFAQDTTFSFGDGQNAQMPVPIIGGDKGSDPWFIDGDVRNTRLNLTWDGPALPSVPKLGAMVEVDFFGGTAGGGFGNAQPVPRLRIATAQIALGDMTLKIGQDWAPLFGNVPVSLAHLGFPLGYGSAGTIGWRFPGIWLIVPLSPKDAEMQLKVTLAVLRNSWTTAAALNPPNLGNTGVPQLEGRVDVATKLFSLYAVGHVDVKDLDGRGDAMDNEGLTAFAVEAGVKLNLMPLTIMANGYFGKAIGHQFGNLVQFGDIAGFGAWGQVGFDATPNVAIYAFFGFDKPDEDDVRAAVPIATPPVPANLPKLMNIQAAAMIRYKVGPYQIGLEYMLDQLTFADTTSSDDKVTGNQLALSVNYGF